MLIKDRLVSNGGWIEREGVTCFNLYRPPISNMAMPQRRGRGSNTFTKSTARTQAHHQVPGLQGSAAAGQDQSRPLAWWRAGHRQGHAAEPIKYAVGPWNFEEVSPKQVCGRFNGFIKSVILRISELRDLGDGNRFDFYEHMKVLTAPPPDVLRVDEKHLREYSVFNVCGVIITTNYKTNGIYLPAEDRRHFVAWSTRRKSDFTDAYWDACGNGTKAAARSCRRLSRQARYFRFQSEGGATQDGGLLGHCRCQPVARG